MLFDENITVQKRNETVLEKVAQRLVGKGYTIFQKRAIKSSYEVGNATADMLLEFLTGHKIASEKFTLSDVSQFDAVFYYDNNFDRIVYLKKINEILNVRLENTKKEIAKTVTDFVNNADVTLSLNGISNNEVNPISTYFIKIGAMKKYLKSFESWMGL